MEVKRSWKVIYFIYSAHVENDRLKRLLQSNNFSDDLPYSADQVSLS